MQDAIAVAMVTIAKSSAIVLNVLVMNLEMILELLLPFVRSCCAIFSLICACRINQSAPLSGQTIEA